MAESASRADMGAIAVTEVGSLAFVSITASEAIN
jgi:hypothetical protein